MDHRSHDPIRAFTAAVLLMVLGYSLCFNILNVTMNPIITEFSLEGTSQGLVSSMMNLGSLISLIILPMLQGRIQKYYLILIAVLLQIATLVLTGLSASFGLLLTANLLLGAGYNAADSCVNSYFVDLYPDNSGAMGLLHGVFGVGGLLTPLLITAIINRSGWRVSYYIAAAIFAAITSVFVITGSRRHRDIAESTRVETRLSVKMLAEYFGTRRNLIILIASLLCAAGQMGLISWVVRYIFVRFGEGASAMGTASVSAYWICCTACRLFAPRLPFNRRRMPVVGAFAAGIAHMLGVLIGSPVAMVVGCGLNGLLSGLCIPTLISLAAIGNEDRTSLTTSANFLIMAVGRMLIPIAMAAIAVKSIIIAMLLPAVCMSLSAVFCALAQRIPSHRP